MKWLLLDTASTTHLISNQNLVSNIRPSNRSQGVLSNGGELDVNQEGDLDGIGVVPFTNDGIANLLSMAKLVDQGFRVYIDTDVEDAILVFKPDGRIIKFERSDNGLYYHDTKNRQVSLMNSQYENSMMYTRRQVYKAREARNLYQMMGYPSVNDFKNAIKYKYIDDSLYPYQVN